MRRLVLLGTAIISMAAFVVLSLFVRAGTTQGVDNAVRQFFRPNDVWGVNQKIFEHFIDALAPPVTASLLLAAGGVSAWRLRSMRPMVLTALSICVAASLTIVIKAALHRPDPHGGASWLGGAYPSGHVLMVVISLGCTLLLLRAPATWWLWMEVALVALILAVSLLLVATHWLTDIVGGALLGIILLATLHNTQNRALAAEEKCRVVPAERDLEL